MSQLALFAISIDDVRDVFGADAALAERLRGIAATRFAPARPRRRGFLRPLLARDPHLEVDPAVPSRQDVDALLTGAYITPERTPQSWAILTVWLEELAAETVRVPWNPEGFERIEWNLATAGLNSDYSLRRLAERPLGVPLHPAPGQVVGYAKHVHAVETLAALTHALAAPEVSDDAKALGESVCVVLRVAAEAGTDVVTVGV